MKSSRAILLLLVGAVVAAPSSAVKAQELPLAPAEGSAPASIAPKEAERLFLGYINDRKNLIRSCMFLGGVHIEELSAVKELTTARIRYRIECSQEEITMPPLTRTMRESFVFRKAGEHWEILGRASEIRPEQPGASAPPGAPKESPPPDPLDRDREFIAGQILSWAVLAVRPEGVDQTYPGTAVLSWKSPVLVSGENLGGVGEFAVGEMKALVLSPEALLERTVFANGGVWFRFDTLDIDGGSARVRVSLVAPVMPAPRPGEALTRVLSRVDADFLRNRTSWILTRYRVEK